MKPIYKFFSAFFLTCIIPIIGLTQNNKHFNSVGYPYKPISKIEENKKRIIEYLKSKPQLELNSQSTQSERSIAFSTREYSLDNQQTLNFDSTRLHYFSANVGWLFTFNENSEEEIFGVDTAYNYSYYLGVLIKTSRYTFQYNSSGFNVSQKEDTLAGNTWNLVSTTTYTRNSSNKVVSQISNPPSYKTENTYNANNYLLTQINSNWDGTQYVMNSSKNISYYPNNNIFTQTNSYYELGILNYEKVDSIIYNNNNLPLVVFGKTTNASGGVANVSKTKTINSFTGNNLDVSLTQTFDGVNSVYSDSYKTSYTYSGNNALEDLTQFWNSFDNAWQNSSKITYAYYGNNLSSSTYFFWNSTDLNWAENSKVENTYTTFSNIKTIINFLFYNSTWTPTNSNYFFYGLYTPNATYTSKLNPFEVYPNPANNFIFLNLTDLKGNSQINIFDVLGKNVLTLQLSNVGSQVNVPVNNLSKGTYVVSVANNGQTRFSKFVKE